MMVDLGGRLENTRFTRIGIADYLADGTFRPLSSYPDGRELAGFVDTRLKERKLKPHAVYVVQFDRDSRESPYAGAAMTQEGDAILLVNQAFMEMPMRMRKAVLDHELSHSQNGDLSEQAMQRVALNPALKKAMENMADKQSICSSQNPKKAAADLAAAVEYKRNRDAALLIKRSIEEQAAGMSLQQAKQTVENVSVGNYPSYLERIADIKGYPERCGNAPHIKASSSKLLQK